MSWVSKWWHEFKGGKSDVQTVGDLVVAGLDSAQKTKLRARLLPVSFAVNELARYSNDQRVFDAIDTVNDMLAKLEQ